MLGDYAAVDSGFGKIWVDVTGDLYSFVRRMATFNSVNTQRAIDLALLTYIMERGKTYYGRIKLQKTTFLAELKLRDNDLVGTHFRFYRWNKGPFSKELWSAVDLLSAKGFVHKGAPSLTRRGQELMEFVLELKRASENRKFFAVLDEALSFCGPKNGGDLMDAVYDMQVWVENSNTETKIRDILVGTDILVPPNTVSLEIAHDLERLLLEELEISETDIKAATERAMPQMEKQLVTCAMNAAPQSS